MLMSVWAGMLTLAWAGPGAYESCCEAADAGNCPANLAVFGPGTARSGHMVQGVWQLSCHGGAQFDASAARATAPTSGPGDVLSALDATAAQCFDATCDLPPQLCLESTSAGTRVVRCADGTDPDLLAWRQPAQASSHRAVVIGKRVLKATEAQPPALRQPTRTAYVAAAPPPIAAAPRPVAIARPVAPPPAPVFASASRGLDAEDLTVPSAPHFPCVPDPALRAASDEQTNQASDAMISGNASLAIGKLRAALTINECNAHAWAALGEAFINNAAVGQAREALEAATRLMPRHFHAWTRLGEAAEKTGDLPAASIAYSQALTSRPGHSPAMAGLERVQRLP
jgi:hypothetical protein